MRLFTVIMDYRGGTYISQVKAGSLGQAIRKWIERFDTRVLGRKYAFTKRAMVQAYDEESDRPVPVDNVRNVWCTTLRVQNYLALVNLVETAAGPR